MNWINKKNIITLTLIILIYAVSQILIGIGIIDSYVVLNLVLVGINIILAVSLNLITGFTGQFSLGHAAFMSVGAYTSAIMTSKLGYSFIISLLVSAIVASLVGLIIGIPTLRLKGDYLAIATLGFSEIIRIVFLNIDYLGGASGFNDIPQYTTWTWVYAMIIITVFAIKNFIDSYAGRACIAIREDEIAAEAMGINTTFYKVLAFIIGAFFAGIAGSLYANYFYFIKPNNFGFMKSVDILVIVVFGGMGSIKGSIVGAIVLSIISLVLQSVPELRMIIYSIILFLIMVYRPEGLLGKYENKKLSNKNWFKKGGKLNGGTDNR